MFTWAGAAALADSVHKSAHAVVVDVALAGAVDGWLLAVQVRVQAQLSQWQHSCTGRQTVSQSYHTLCLEAP